MIETDDLVFTVSSSRHDNRNNRNDHFGFIIRSKFNNPEGGPYITLAEDTAYPARHKTVDEAKSSALITIEGAIIQLQALKDKLSIKGDGK